MKKLLLAITTITMLISCAPSPRDIEYGLELCSFCKMTIVDQTYAAETVTSKGKVYVFDAIECMIHHTDRNPGQAHAFELVSHYGNPGVLENAHESYFLISEKMPSPMGANLTAFATQGEAVSMRDSLGGDVYSWEALQAVIMHNEQAGQINLEYQ